MIDREIAQKGPQAERTIVTEGSAEPYGFFCQDSVEKIKIKIKHENSKGVALGKCEKLAEMESRHFWIKFTQNLSDYYGSLRISTD